MLNSMQVTQLAASQPPRTDRQSIRDRSLFEFSRR
jgi:hypothetical protein